MIDFDCERYHNIDDFIKLIAILRAPGGCPWDIEQTHESLRQNCLEEAYEVCEAIDEGDSEHLKEELGDLLMQVIFHAGLETDAGNFTFSDICDAACRKLINRHPHVFGDREKNRGAHTEELWEKAKRSEHGQRSTADAVEGVARALPAVWRAQKMLKKAAPAEAPEKAAADLLSAAEAIAASPESISEADFGEITMKLAALANSRGINAELSAQRACEDFAARCRREHPEDN